MLFNKDIFSYEKICYMQIDSETRFSVSNVLQSEYFHSSVDIQELVAVGALGINSQNYRALVDGVFYHVKRLDSTASIGLVNSQYNLSEHLRQNGHSFPEVIVTKQNHLIAVDSNQRGWIVTRFQPGNYFSGFKTELPVVADAIGHLFHDLASDLCKESAESDRFLNTSRFSTNYIETLIPTIIYSKAKLPPSDYLLLFSHLKSIESTINTLYEHSACVLETSSLIGHIDLHPHNLLIKPDGRPMFLDVESLRLHPTLMSLGFGIYKLMRQFGVRYSGRSSLETLIAQNAMEMCKRIIKLAKLSDMQASMLPCGAAMEVCRRLNVIVELNVFHGSTKWNRVLPIHLAGLEEIPIIFSLL